MFDFENMQSKFQEERRNLNAVRERLRAVNEIDLAQLMSDACALMEDEALQLLASKLSFKGLLDLRDAIQHVPNNISRIVNGISLRLSFIFKIFKSLLSQKKDRWRKLRALLFISVAINRITYLSTVSIISQSGSVFRRIKFIKVLHYMKKMLKLSILCFLSTFTN